MKQLLDFEKTNGLIPTVIQDDTTSIVYMVGYVNKEALDLTQKTGLVHFWSRTRKKIWMKGEESGNTLVAKKIYYDCDADTLLIKVKLNGTHVCHTGELSCFHNPLLFTSKI